MLRRIVFSIVPLHFHMCHQDFRKVVLQIYIVYTLIVCLMRRFYLRQIHKSTSHYRLQIVCFSLLVHWSPQVNGSGINNVRWHDPISNARRHKCPSCPDGGHHELRESRLKIKDFIKQERQAHDCGAVGRLCSFC